MGKVCKMIFLSMLTLLMSSTLVGCSFPGGYETSTNSKILLTEISLTASSNSVTVGESVTFTFSPIPSDAGIYNNKSYSVNYVEYFVGNTRFDKSKQSAQYTFNTVGEFEVWAKYCTHSNHTDTDGDLVSNRLSIDVRDIDESLILRVPQPTESSYMIPQPSNAIDHTITTTFQSGGATQYTFNYTAPTDGYHYFVSSLSVYWTIKDSSNNTVRSRGPNTASTVGLTLKSGMRYSFIIDRGSTYGDCTIDLYAPNPISIVTQYTNITDSMRFKGQIAKYLYTPSVTGHFYLTSSMRLYYMIEDDFGNTVRSRGPNTTNAVGITLQSGKEYKISLEQASNFGDFTFVINVPNSTQNINGKIKVYDYMRFETQSNSYIFTANKAGEYNFNVSYSVYITIKDKFGNNTRSKGPNTTKSVIVSLVSGMEYTLILEQASSIGEYILGIVNP